jgi:DNA-binding MarR family transcriptional regulator
MDIDMKKQTLSVVNIDHHDANDQDADNMAGASDYKLDDQVGFIMRCVNQRHLSIFSRLIPELTPTQFSALAKLCASGQASQNELGRMIAIDAATIKGVVDRLKQRGLLSSESQPSDLRRLILKPTEKGRQLFQQMIDAAHQVSEETLKPLSEKEKQTFINLLLKLR